MSLTSLRHLLSYGVTTAMIIMGLDACAPSRYLSGYGSTIKWSSTSGSLYKFSDSLGYHGRDTLWTTHFYRGQRHRVEGRVAVEENGATRLLRIGHWKDLDTTGQILREGEYEIGRYINCCTHGYCSFFYNYRHGPWTFWHPNGQMRAQGTFLPQRRPMATSCKGGDWLWFGEIDPRAWSFWTEEGLPTNPSDDEVRLLERVVFDLNGKGRLITLSRTKNNELVIGDID